jgi:hypothetical protein
LFADGSSVLHFAVLSNIWDWEPVKLIEWHREKAGTIERAHDVLKNVRALIDGFAEPLFDGSSGKLLLDGSPFGPALPLCATSTEEFWQCLVPATNQISDRVRQSRLPY